MYLCDDIIASARTRTNKMTRTGTAILGEKAWRNQCAMFDMMARKVSTAVRYILDDEVIGHACAAMHAKPTTTLSCLSLLRVPHTAIWCEWREPVRNEIRIAMELVDAEVSPDLLIPERMGFLVETDTDGRKGVITYAWKHAPNEKYPLLVFPNICPIQQEFDLDDDGIVVYDSKGDLNKRFEKWASDPVQYEAIQRMESKTTLDLPDWGARDIMARAEHEARALRVTAEERAIFLTEGAKTDVIGEFNQFLSIIMMLTAKNGVSQIQHSWGDLNKSRAKQGKPRLLDHVIVKMRLLASERKQRNETGSGATGTKRRHLVAGHYVVRKVPHECIYYRRPHERGKGDSIAMKTVKIIP
jgi:hypothetical protein